MQANPHVQAPNIVAGFKNNIGPSVQIQPTMSQTLPPTPLQQPYQALPQVSPQVVQQVQLPPPQTQLEIMQPVTAIVPTLDTLSILGYELQKKYVYIAAVIILGILAYFIWKWWVGPQKKSKKGKHVQDEEEYEEDDDEEEEDDVYIPQYQSKTSESKNKKRDDE
jgi:hypothetical protein